MAGLVKNGYLTEKTSVTAAASLVPNFNSSVRTNSETVHYNPMYKLFNNGVLYKLTSEAKSG